MIEELYSVEELYLIEELYLQIEELYSICRWKNYLQIEEVFADRRTIFDQRTIFADRRAVFDLQIEELSKQIEELYSIEDLYLICRSKNYFQIEELFAD